MRVAAFLSLLIFSAMASPGQAPNQSANRVWITDVFLVSPERLDHVDKGSVLVENGRILEVYRNPKAKRPAGAAIFSGKGQYLIPGLIDSHVHLASIPGMPDELNKDEERMERDYFKQLPRSYLYFGYTTLVDLAVIDQHVLDDFRQSALHPDLYDCGESLPIANGYPMSFAPPAARFKLFPNFIYDAKQAGKIPPEYKPEDHTPAVAVARVKSSGGVCVKTYFERGFAEDRNLPVWNPDAFAEVRKAATENGLVLMIHANSFEAQRFAVDGNVDVIAHGMWNWGEFDKPDAVLPEEIRRLLDQIAARRIGYQPTIQVMSGIMAYFDSAYLKTEGIAKVIPKEMLEWYQTPQGRWFAKELGEGEGNVPDAVRLAEFEKGPMHRVRLVVEYLASKDANFLFGTDTPSSPTYGNLPGLNGYLEMKQLQKAGMSLAQIFRAATINNAREFKLESQIGTIEKGKIANLVLMRQSPLETVDAYDSITAIWMHGHEISRDSLAVDASR